MKKNELQLPQSLATMTKGSSLASILSEEAITCLAHNLRCFYKSFDKTSFQKKALKNIEPLSLMQRGPHLAQVLRQHLPDHYEDAVDVLIQSLTPPLTRTKDNGLGVFFYLPHTCFISTYGLDAKYNSNRDPFKKSMQALYELTRRFTAEFSIRSFLIQREKETLKQLLQWTKDPDPHVRRLCSEGTRPRLPWATRIPAFIKDPRPSLPILEALKDDKDLYVRRSVANHLGDIAKDHFDLAIEICETWLKKASPERKWLIRHALRYPAKKGIKKAVELRKKAN